jgi:hypothetical protein
VFDNGELASTGEDEGVGTTTGVLHLGRRYRRRREYVDAFNDSELTSTEGGKNVGTTTSVL